MPRTQDNSLKFSIGKLWNSGEGTTEKFELDVPVSFKDKDLNPVSNLVADVMMIKLREEISVIVSNAKITVKRKCEKCLEDFTEEVHIPEASREFISGKLDQNDDPNENFMINFEDSSIDLNEMVRQEIFLHFPLISVCSKSCKGICPICGKNKNKSVCKCKPVDAEANKPLNGLKKLMSN